MRSQTSADISRGVRTPVTVSSESTRTVDERILIRFPVLARIVARGWSLLPPRSRLRRNFTAHIWRSGIEAANRQDLDVMVLAMDPNFELELTETSAGYVPPDLVGVHRGPEGFIRAWERLNEAWDLRFEPEEVIDFGDRLFAAGHFTAQGRHTGIALESPLFQVVTIRRGLFARQQDFSDRDEALRAAIE